MPPLLACAALKCENKVFVKGVGVCTVSPPSTKISGQNGERKVKLSVLLGGGSMAEDPNKATIIEYFKAHLERQRPIFNPCINNGTSSVIKFNPVFRFSPYSTKLICDRADIITHPSGTMHQSRGELDWMHYGVGFLIIGYKTGIVSYASCFRVHQRLYLTSLQNTLPIPSYQGNIEPVRYWWSPGIKVPYCLSDVLRREDDSKEEGIIPLTLLPRDANFQNLLPDLDPRSKKPMKYPSNFAFLNTTSSQFDNLPFFTPCPLPPCSGDHIALMGYHKPYPDPFWLNELFDRRMSELPVSPSPYDIEAHFHGFGVKSVSPGCILSPVSAFDEMGGLRVILHDASTYVGSTGSPVIPLIPGAPPSFIAIHSGSWTIADLCTNPKDVKEGVVPDCTVAPNYNISISVHHPHFVAEYVSKVVPLFAGNLPNSVKHYLHMHRKVLEELGIFPPI